MDGGDCPCSTGCSRNDPVQKDSGMHWTKKSRSVSSLSVQKHGVMHSDTGLTWEAELGLQAARPQAAPIRTRRTSAGGTEDPSQRVSKSGVPFYQVYHVRHIDGHTSRDPVVALVMWSRSVLVTVASMAGAAGAAKRSNVRRLWR